MNMVLGIDTGGTFTDGILFDFAGRQVLAAAKALTTRYDLTVGILNAIDALPIQEPGAIRLVSISTTLATNAIAEGKGKRVALFLIGYDQELVRRFDFGARLATPLYEFFRGGHDLFGQEKEPCDCAALAERARELVAADAVDAFAVSAYFSPLNPKHEQQAFDALRAVTDRPIVLAHHLATKLNSIERATTASLNAALVPLLRDFVAAVQRAMEARAIRAPLMIVRGDGSLMAAAVADRHAIETIHSGPAASAIGGRFLSGRDPALVVDIGGTTTDIGVVDGGHVMVSEDGTSVAGYRTAVLAANIRSFGLGGDSWLTIDKEEQLCVGPQRVTPLAYLAQQYPRVHSELLALAQRRPSEALVDGLEYWFLLREVPANGDPRVTALAQLLAEGPQPLPTVLQALNLTHPMQFAGYRLVEREVIGRAGLTPTDLLHTDGRFVPWDRAAATAAAAVFAGMQGWTVPQLQDKVAELMTAAIVAEIVQFLAKRALPAPDVHARRHDLGRWFFENSLTGADKYLETRFRLKMPIIGIGAPAGIFLPGVAERLGTDLVLPPHFGVANAVGAVAGSIMATCEAWVYARMRDVSTVGYVAQVGGARHRFSNLADALDFARREAARQAEAEALRNGAVAPQVHIDELPNGVDNFRLRVQAMGNPRLMSVNGTGP